MRLLDPESTALELLVRTGQSGPPVDLDRIAALWPGLKISVENLEREGYLVDLGAQGAEILIRAADPLPRRRYTLAHELGHWVLQCSGLMSYDHSTAIPHTAIERWCDHFAAALLMPQAWVIQGLRRAKLSGLLRAVLSAPPIYQVSHQAFRLRISELTPVSLFQLRQKEDTVSIELRYETRSVPNTLVSKTLQRVMALISETGESGRYLHPETQFLSIRMLLPRNTEEHNWLVCILPRTSPKGTSRGSHALSGG
jgi:Zn-dependent peptidase ImmA (M78 family)